MFLKFLVLKVQIGFGLKKVILQSQTQRKSKKFLFNKILKIKRMVKWEIGSPGKEKLRDCS